MKRAGFFILIFFFLIAIFITWPLIFHLKDFTTGYGDELLIAWIHTYVSSALFHFPLHSLSLPNGSIFNSPLFYPYPNTLAYSDTFFVTSILASPFFLLLHEPIVYVNLTLISSLALLGFSTYLITNYCTKNTAASILAGLLVIFSPAVLDKKIHLQILSCEAVLFAYYFYLKFLNTQKTKYFLTSLLFFILQMYNSFLPGYFILFGYMYFTIFYALYRKKSLLNFFTRTRILFAVFAIICTIPVIIPYFSVSAQFHYVRDIRDSIHYALQPEDFLVAGNDSRLKPLLEQIQNTERYPTSAEIKPGFIGFVFSILAIIVCVYWVKHWKQSWYLTSSVILGTTGLILSLGPFLHIGRVTIHHPFPIPLPYLVLYYLAPGFAGFRNSARWEMLFIIGMSVAIGIVLTRIFEHKSLFFKVAIYIILFSGILAEFHFPMKFYPIVQTRNFPKEYAWIAHNTKQSDVILQLPIYNWYTPHVENELFREYYSTQTFRRTINGYSGFSPNPWMKLNDELLRDFPSGKTVKELEHLHVTYIIVHANEYDTLSNFKNNLSNQYIKSGSQILQQISKFKDLQQIERFNNTYIFRLQ